MIKFIYNFLIFALLSVILYSIVIYVSGKYTALYMHKNLYNKVGDYGMMKSRIHDVENKGPVDVVFLGSSHAYRGFDTRIFEQSGIKSFNLGSTSQTPIQTLLLVDKYIDRLSPKLIIYEVYPETFCMDGVESALDILENTRIDRYTLKMILKVNHILVFNSFLYNGMNQIFSSESSMGESVQTPDNYYIEGGGFVARKKTFYKNTAHPPYKFEFLPGQLEAFDKVLKRIKEKNINFILVESPLTKTYFESFTNASEADSLLNLRGRLFNFNNMISLDDSLHFYDKDHLNQDGVEIFNTELINIITKEKLLPN